MQLYGFISKGITRKYLTAWFNAFVSLKIIIWNGCYTSTFQLFHTRKQNLCIKRIWPPKIQVIHTLQKLSFLNFLGTWMIEVIFSHCLQLLIIQGSIKRILTQLITQHHPFNKQSQSQKHPTNSIYLIHENNTLITEMRDNHIAYSRFARRSSTGDAFNQTRNFQFLAHHKIKNNKSNLINDCSWAETHRLWTELWADSDPTRCSDPARDLTRCSDQTRDLTRCSIDEWIDYRPCF